ncbi:MAG: ABC transporter ATP-binding protein [Leptospiraceae bacterium]|nr:ABC transporter ATP-binding protein [Leptospiraceae bacterium]
MKHENARDDTVFEVKNLSKTYNMGEINVNALHDINFTLNSGELVVLLGPSGSGKSTLLNILGGLDTPTAGSVSFKGKNLFGENEEGLTLFRRKHVGFVFQFYNLIPSLTSRENVSLVTELSNNPMTPEDAIELVDLSNRIDHFPAQLSGGEQQRVSIARAIAKRPSVLLCDEPTGALDFKTGRIVLEAIAKVNKDLGTTTIIITHNASITGMADRVITMRDGTIISNKINSQKISVGEITW